MRSRPWLLPFLASCQLWRPLGAVRLQRDLASAAAGAGSGLSQASAVLRASIRWRFAAADSDGDSVVTLEELKAAGLGHAPGPAGERLLRRMLEACAGRAGASACAVGDLEASLRAWPERNARPAAVSLLSSGMGSFASVEDDRNATEEKCGPSAEPTFQPGRDPLCLWQGAKCWDGDGLAAWAQPRVCSTRGCICEPTAQTKRMAKLGLAGALAVTTAKNFWDPHDTLSAPSCGQDWVMEKVVGRAENLTNFTEDRRKHLHEEGIKIGMDDSYIQAIFASEHDDTEAAIFRSPRHQLRKGGPLEPVCMISWQATRAPSDWHANLMDAEAPFDYAPPGVNMTFDKGFVSAYQSIREKLKAAYERLCCSEDFRARATVISGHSRGADLSVVNAIDAVSWWRCGGEDLGAENLALVVVAPKKHLLSMEVIDRVLSCTDTANCLAGSVATLVTRGDWVGDYVRSKRPEQDAPFHPSLISWLPCDAKPKDVRFYMDDSWWCHGIFNYMPAFEEHLVKRAGWGSTCGGCGDTNRLVQCNLVVLLANRGCSYANSSWLKTPTQCNASDWDSEEEVCHCHFDRCDSLTTLGCYT